MKSPAAAAGARLRAPTPTRLEDLTGPKPWPVFGNALQMDLPRMHQQVEDWADRYGPLYRLKFGRKTMVVLSDGALIASLLRDRPDGWRRMRAMRSVINEMGGDGVFSAEGEDWRRQRRLVMSAFDPGHLARFFPSLVRVTERLDLRFARIAGQATRIELQAQLMRYTVDVTAGLAFGTDVNTLESEGDVLQTHLDKIFPMIYRRLNMPFPYWRHLRLPADRAFDRHLAAVDVAVHGFIADARRRLAEEPERATRPRNLLEALLAARDADGTALSESQIVGNVLTVLLAGEDTTANTLCWALYLLHRHPDAWNALVAEVDAALGDARIPTRIEILGELPHLEACVQEAMRLHPVAPLFFLEPNADAKLGDLHVPKGTTVFCVMRKAALDPALGADVADFNPSRWTGADSAGKSALHHASRPFGGGPRLCPGRNLAMMEMKMVLALIARNYTLVEVGTESGRPPAERLSFAMSPVGLRLALGRRAGR